MTTETAVPEKEGHQIVVKNQGSSASLYGMGLIGAWVYYIGRATTNQERVKGFFKALVWPATLVYEALKLLKKE